MFNIRRNDLKILTLADAADIRDGFACCFDAVDVDDQRAAVAEASEAIVSGFAERLAGCGLRGIGIDHGDTRRFGVLLCSADRNLAKDIWSQPIITADLAGRSFPHLTTNVICLSINIRRDDQETKYQDCRESYRSDHNARKKVIDLRIILDEFL